MGSGHEDEESKDYRENQGKLKPSSVIILFLLSVLIVVAGGSVLGWWLHKYHPDNRELWMVPFGLILFFTPIVIWFSLIVSDLCVSNSNRLDHPTDDSVWDPSRWSEKVSF